MTRNKPLLPTFDYPLLVLMAALVGFGLVMVFSASYAFAYVNTENPLYFFIRQLIWTGIGAGALVVALNIDYRLWRKWALPIMAITLLLLVLVFGAAKFGARRQFFDGSVQPSEIAKLAIIIYIAAWLSSKGSMARNVSISLVPFAVLLGLLVGLILAQPDIDTAMMISVTAVAMFFIAGANLVQMVILTALGAVTFAAVIILSPHAHERMTIFISSISNPIQTQNFHLRGLCMPWSKAASSVRGCGTSVHKLPGGLPAVHSDSIFAVVGELGLVGTLLRNLALFLFFAYRGTRIAMAARDSFGALLAFGITTWLVAQAFINMAVITATFPLSGLPLPFFSYGGSSTVINLGAVGILLNISRGGGGIRFDALDRLWRRNRRPRLSDPDHGGGSARGLRTTGYARSRR
ncbi:MAG: cell division protein FtsW [Caldilineales bacterium]|nr:cell division protein FtsW [Caldilineales bacterium]